MRSIAGLLLSWGLLAAAGCSPVSTKAAAKALANQGPATAGVSADASTGASGDAASDGSKITWVGTKPASGGRPAGKHDGGFKKFTASITPATGNITASTITLEIDTASLWADDPKLTNHLKSPDFFEVNAFPTAKFVSTSIKEARAGDNTHTVTGDLTLHGTTKPITIPVKITQTGSKVAINGEFKMKRMEYGITFNKAPVDDDVAVKVSLNVDRK
jgi:polyisoprenoid-binding protein YceI